MYRHAIYGLCSVAEKQQGAGGLFVRVKLISRQGPDECSELVVGWRAMVKVA